MYGMRKGLPEGGAVREKQSLSADSYAYGNVTAGRGLLFPYAIFPEVLSSEERAR